MTCRQGTGCAPHRSLSYRGRRSTASAAAIRRNVMRAVIITQPGGPEVMRLEEVPDPVPGRGEVLVAVAGGGLNRADVRNARGTNPPPPGPPPYPGWGG